MIKDEIVTGQLASWALMKKLGEGDAGEVYLVETLVGMRRAILKRPTKSAFAGDVARQAAQMRTEERILKALSGFLEASDSLHIGVPGLIDQSRPELDFGDRMFIILEQAQGFDLSFLARTGRIGLPTLENETEENTATLSLEEEVFLSGIAKFGKVPERILLKILYSLLSLFEKIHYHRFDHPEGEAWGIIWNDVKPEHLFWDAKRGSLTLIDWGNSQFLEADGTTHNRQYSRYDDYRQLFEEMDRYMGLAAPDLRERLDWPARIQAENSSADALKDLKARIETALEEAETALAEARQAEAGLLGEETASDSALEQLEMIQKQIIAFGELPDIAGALRLAAGRAAVLTRQDHLHAVREICHWAEKLPRQQGQRWEIVERLARITGRSEGDQRSLFLQAIQAAICEDWENVLWNVLAAIQEYPEPEWWFDLSDWLRRKEFGVNADALRPLVGFNRFFFGLQASIRQMEPRPSPGMNLSDPLDRARQFARLLKDEVINNWTLIDPPPPYSGLTYSDVEAFLSVIAEIYPEEQRNLTWLLVQSCSQVDVILEAWSRQDFLTAQIGLRRLLLWDPDRRRVLRADRAIQTAPLWLRSVHQGPEEHEHLLDFVTRLEFEGRQMRNQTGEAVWLDGILEGLKRLRHGEWPGDLLASSPGLLKEMPWLKKFVRLEEVRKLSLKGYETVETPEIQDGDVLHGVLEARIGPEEDIALEQPLDAWIPEARGSSARVYRGSIKNNLGVTSRAAIKFMRMDKVDYALPLFKEEAQILTQLIGVSGVTRMLECGFVQLELGEARQFPLDSSIDKIQALEGPSIRIGPDTAAQFLDQLSSRVKEGWIPYIALEERDPANNLLRMCDAGLNRGLFLPVAQLVQMAIQICDILEVAHSHKIVYRDHKILHYYWLPESNGIYVIDWNIARFHPDGLSVEEIHMDLVQFGARGLHHILTGRAAPGALPLGPTRPDEIELAAQSYKTQWTFDDQRLPADVKEILERVLAGEYSSAAALRGDLKQAYMQNPNS